jgi:hypothetical protein
MMVAWTMVDPPKAVDLLEEIGVSRPTPLKPRRRPPNTTNRDLDDLSAINQGKGIARRILVSDPDPTFEVVWKDVLARRPPVAAGGESATQQCC